MTWKKGIQRKPLILKYKVNSITKNNLNQNLAKRIKAIMKIRGQSRDQKNNREKSMKPKVGFGFYQKTRVKSS